MLAWQVARDIHVEHRIKDCGPRTEDPGQRTQDSGQSGSRSKDRTEE